MKNLKMLYIALIALVTGAFGACTTNDYAPGAQASGPQVSFAADNVTSVEFSGNAGEGPVTLILNRVETEKELTVFILSEVKDSDAALFSIPETASFDAGEATTELVVTADPSLLENDKVYNVKLYLDEQVATPYGYAEWNLSFALNPWELMKDSKGNNVKGKFRGMDLMLLYNAMDPSPEIEVNVYEHKATKGLYKVESPWKPLITAMVGGADKIPAGVSIVEKDFIIDASNPEQVKFADQGTGVIWDPAYGEMCIVSGEAYNLGHGSLVNGVITFPVKSTLVYEALYPTDLYYGSPNGMFRMILPGYEATDYSLAVAYDGMDVAADNVTTTAKFKFTYGDDVTGVKYLLVDGNVESDPTAALTTLFAGEDENIRSIEEFVIGGKVANVRIGLETGIYSIVAAPQDKNGELSANDAIVMSFYFKGIGEAESHPCEIEGSLMSVSEFNPALTAAYPDHSSLVYELIGTQIKSVRTYMNKSSIVATWTGTPESLVAEYGTDASAEVIAYVNSNDGYAGVYSNRAPDTEYTLIIVATNEYGESKTLILTKKTAAVPYDGELVIGDYEMTCTMTNGTQSQTFENVFNIINKLGSNTEFEVSEFGIEDTMKWVATYNSAASTLTLSGIAVGYEDKDPFFGSIYGYFDSAQTQGYGIFSYANADAETGEDPIVLKVDPTTKQLCGLKEGSEFYVYVVSLANGALLGSYNAFDDTTVIAPYVPQATGQATVKSLTSIVNGSKEFSWKKLLTTKSKWHNAQATAIAPMRNTKSVTTVKPLVVERYTPSQSTDYKVKTNAKFAR